MDINTMLTKRAKLLERIDKLSSRIERDKASLQKAQDELQQTMKGLMNSADLMADILGLDPDQVRDKLLQQPAGEILGDSLSMDTSGEDALQSQTVYEKSEAEYVSSDDLSDLSAIGDASLPSSEKPKETGTDDNICGLKIDPFSQAL